MTEPMKYGQTEFEVHLPPELIAAELEPNQVDLPQRTTAEHIRWALDHPIDSAPLKELVKAGDKVIYSKYSGTEVEIEDEKYVIVKQNDILAVVK